ncbi:MAG: hypothetical protein ABEH60_03740 [Halonotius sp.]
MALMPQRAVGPFRQLRRLPYGSNHDIGAGYAMALAAAVATGLYFGVQAVLILLLVVSIDIGSTGLFLAMLPIGMLSGAVSTAAFVAPFGFVAGVLAWRAVPGRYRYAGALGGLVAPLLVYLFAAVVGILVGIVGGVVVGDPIGRSVITAVGIVAVAFGATCWITLPLGALAGTLYERARSDES